MKWDVFIAHASEDKDFARELVEELQKWGLEVWFDELRLSPGDSLRRAIDQGLLTSRYGIVILSKNFFIKEWPKKELDALVAREDGHQKIIIPIWHDVTANDVRRFSPILADKLSIFSSGHIEGVAEKVVQAICKDQFSKRTRSISSYSLPDGTEIILLPTRPRHNYAVGISKYPITNSQYSKFVEASGHDSPVGEEFRDGSWRGPFSPWDNNNFNDPNQPVVCVNFHDADDYCEWVNRLLGAKDRFFWWRQLPVYAFIPNAGLWDFAAFGTIGSLLHPLRWKLKGKQNAHHKSSTPAVIDATGARENEQGVSDMFGNVWEWCYGDRVESDMPTLTSFTRSLEVELRGGSFLDDLRQVRLYLRASNLADSVFTKHFDLGFRIAALFRTDKLPKDTCLELSVQESLSNYFWINVNRNFENMERFSRRRGAKR